MQIKKEQVDLLEYLLSKSFAVSDAIAQSVGDTNICDGVWRFYSTSWPAGGLAGWNDAGWRKAWGSSIPEEIVAFGEDVFGNQLFATKTGDRVFLWNHEDGAVEDLYLDVVKVLRLLLKEGLGWIEMYGNGSLLIAKQFDSVSRDFHLHWTTPLVLGGSVSSSNVSFVLRDPHLVGHAKLWERIRGSSAGDTFVVE